LQSGKGDIFECFLVLYHMRRRSRVSVSLSDDVIEEVERRRGLVKRSTYYDSLPYRLQLLYEEGGSEIRKFE
jgi:Arc/MetJ family transcription regulator